MSHPDFLHEIQLNEVNTLIKEPFEITQKLFSCAEDIDNIFDLIRAYIQADRYNKGVIERILSIFYLIRPKQRELLTKIESSIQITHESKLKQVLSTFSNFLFIPYENISNHPIGSLIANDDLGKLQDYVSNQPDFDFTQIIKTDSNSDINLLEAAAYTGSPKCFKYLLINKAPFTDKICALAVSGGNYEIIHFIENQYKDADYSSKECFEASIIHHRYEITDWILLNTKYKPESNDEFTAIEAFNYPAFVLIWVKLLGDTPKREEEEEEDKEIEMDDFFKYFYNDCFQREFCTECLNFAAKAGNLPIIKLLTDKESDDMLIGFFFITKDRKTMYNACKYDHLDIVQYLYEVVNFDIEANHSAVAYESGAKDIIKYFVKKGIDTTSVNFKEEELYELFPIYEPCKEGDLGKMRSMIKKNVYCPNESILWAAKFGHLHIVQYLCEARRINPEVRDSEGKTPLHIACENGYFQVVKYLCEVQKVDTEGSDIRGRTPLYSACEYDHLPVVQYLCEVAKVNTKGALHFACKKGRLHIVQYLCEVQKVNTEAKDNIFERTPLHIACEEGHLSVVKYLCEVAKVNTEATDIRDRTALHIACYYGHLPIVQYLCEVQKVNTKGAYGNARSKEVREYLKSIGAHFSWL